MRFVLFYHSLVSDWNHGNAHFLRGVARELVARGHEVRVLEPADGWSRRQLLADQGPAALERFTRDFPDLSSGTYDLASLDLPAALDGADVVMVHEWSEPELVRRVGAHRAGGGRYALLFHDTHHRSVTAPEELARFDLRHYDAVLAFGEVIRARYARRGCQAFTWHEAADARLFRPLPGVARTGDLVWVGNWGDEERTAELHEFLLRPIRALGLRATVHGVRYPPEALAALAAAGIEHGGWLPNADVPRAFARHRVTVHVPRRPYVEALPGVPTIRVFEALACGVPLVCAPWRDVEGLFRPGEDFLVARSGDDMARRLRELLADPAHAAAVAGSGRETVLARHTCAHRVDELLGLLARLGAEARTPT
ncbi:MAG: glycosyltransferase [Planctomycetes bacterium]|nr:glycosyltransferase [Planctomycetota bacterium]